VIDLLDVASANIADYQNRPLIQASLHAIIGHMYVRLGQYDKAERHVDAALDIRQRELRPPHSELAEALHLKGDWLYWTDRWAESLLLYERALAMRQALPGGQDAEPIAESLSGVGASQLKLNQYDQAERNFRSALDMRRRLHGDRHWLVGAALSNLGMCLKVSATPENGKRDEAESCFRKALDTVENLPVKERNSFNIGRAQHVLAMFLADHSHDDQWEEAELLFRKAIENKIRKTGETHTSVAATLHELARRLFDHDHLESAAESAAKEITILAALNPASVNYADGLILLGRIRAAQGDVDAALDSLNKAADVGDALAKESQIAGATRVLEDCYRAVAQAWGESDPRLRPFAQRLVDFYVSINNRPAAEKYRTMLRQFEQPQAHD
jgi:tetratricopeptide (TPR) repeat protein